VFETIKEKFSNSIGLARLPVELAVSVKERHKAIDVFDGGLSDHSFFFQFWPDRILRPQKRSSNRPLIGLEKARSLVLNQSTISSRP
jgi:hypothetical protein